MPTPEPEAHAFDFLDGEWDAVCRFPRADGSWGSGARILEGPFNRATRNWEHTWTDTAEPWAKHWVVDFTRRGGR